MGRYQDLKDIPFCEKHLPCEACTYRENKLREWYEAELEKVKQELDDIAEDYQDLNKEHEAEIKLLEADLSEALELLHIAEVENREHMRLLERTAFQNESQQSWTCRAARLRERRGR